MLASLCLKLAISPPIAAMLMAMTDPLSGRLMGRGKALDVSWLASSTFLIARRKQGRQASRPMTPAPLIQKTLDELDDVIKRFRELADEYET